MSPRMVFLLCKEREMVDIRDEPTELIQRSDRNTKSPDCACIQVQ
jgi:hypothetical protein